MIKFKQEVKDRILRQGKNEKLAKAAFEFMAESFACQYSYNFTALGRPIIQYPQDILVMQELIWKIKPDLIIETGIAHGGSLISNASSLALLDMCDAIESGKMIDPSKSHRKILGLDIDIREHNSKEINSHPMASRIQMIEGSSVDVSVIEQVKSISSNYNKILVCLDSSHTHDHVLAELEAYSSLVSVGSYCIVFDTFVEDLPKELFNDRPWRPGNNPKTAVQEFIKIHPEFEIDRNIDNQLMISVAPNGFLKRNF